jgi:hypothetical protein
MEIVEKARLELCQPLRFERVAHEFAVSVPAECTDLGEDTEVPREGRLADAEQWRELLRRTWSPDKLRHLGLLADSGASLREPS